MLRKPLGLILSKSDLHDEDMQFHFIALSENRIIGCVVLKPISSYEIKLRQMAVSDRYQGQGIGQSLVLLAIQRAKEIGYTRISAHARMTAIAFYQKLGFEPVGGVFIEVTVPTVKIIKKLTYCIN